MAILFDWYENPKTSEQQGEENMLPVYRNIVH